MLDLLHKLRDAITWFDRGLEGIDRDPISTGIVDLADEGPTLLPEPAMGELRVIRSRCG